LNYNFFKTRIKTIFERTHDQITSVSYFVKHKQTVMRHEIEQ